MAGSVLVALGLPILDTTGTAAEDPAERVNHPAGRRMSAAADDAGRRLHQDIREPLQNCSDPATCSDPFARHPRRHQYAIVERP